MDLHVAPALSVISNGLYLVILPIQKQADLKHVVKVIGDDRLSFRSPERLKLRLGLTPGSVSPFGLINDAAYNVTVIIDAGLKNVHRLISHPNINTASLTISFQDFETFLASRGASSAASKSERLTSRSVHGAGTEGPACPSARRTSSCCSTLSS